MKIVHISDTHRYHKDVIVPECDVLIHSGDIGGRTGYGELEDFLKWFEEQPAKLKLWIAGNHDHILSTERIDRQNSDIGRRVAEVEYKEAMDLLSKSTAKYLNNTEYVYEGTKFYGSPYTPSFHKQNWVFNADRGKEIAKEWAKIPSDVNVLITHGPPYGMLDIIPEAFKSSPDEDVHRGCVDLMDVIKKRLNHLKLHCFGHIHEGPNGNITSWVSRKHSVMFSNGSILDNNYELTNIRPLIITI